MIYLILALVATVLIFTKFLKYHNYWTEKGVGQRKQFPILGENYLMILKNYSFTEMVTHIYKKTPKCRYFGTYQFLKPVLLLKDPELIKQIAVRDFDHFVDHHPILPSEAQPEWGRNLFALNGKKWKRMRRILTPCFTSSKMKMMFVLMSDCAENFTNKLAKDATNKEFEMKEVVARFTNDIVATTAFGVEMDSYTNKDNEFYAMARHLVHYGLWKNIKLYLYLLAPKISEIFSLGMYTKKSTDFFREIVDSTVKIREEKGIVRPDMIQLMMQARNGDKIKETAPTDVDTGFATAAEPENSGPQEKNEMLTLTDMCANALIFFFAGFDSVSSMIAFMAYELALNPSIQDRLREEVDETMKECNGNLTYEALMKMKYMDMVVCESLRKWPNASASDRVCTKPYTIQPSTPDERPVHLPIGSIVWIPMLGLHRDPEHFPNPELFDPERFSDANKHKINPYAYLPFGTGPRGCIASRFSLMEMKMIFFYILSKMELRPSKNTPKTLRETSRKPFVLNIVPGFFIEIGPRK